MKRCSFTVFLAVLVLTAPVLAAQGGPKVKAPKPSVSTSKPTTTTVKSTTTKVKPVSVKTTTSKPVKTTTAKPVKTTTAKPAKTTTTKPVKTTTVKADKSTKSVTKPTKSAKAETKKSTTTSTSGTPTTTETTPAPGGDIDTVPLTKVQEKLQRNTNLASKLQSRLPEGTDLMKAALGFKNLGQFVAAVNVSYNHGYSFKELKTLMVDEGFSLGQAMQKIKADSNTTAIAQSAETDAQRLISTTEAQTTTTTTASTTKKKSKKPVGGIQ